MILTLSGLKEYIIQPIIRKLKLSDESSLVYCVLKVLDELWIKMSAHVNKNPRSTLHLCENISNSIIAAIVRDKSLLEGKMTDLENVVKVTTESIIFGFNKQKLAFDASQKADITRVVEYSETTTQTCKSYRPLMDDFRIKDLLEFENLQQYNGYRQFEIIRFPQKTRDGSLPKMKFQEDLNLLDRLDADPLVERNKQPSTLSAFVHGEYVMTPDVRPSDRRLTSDFVMEPMGPIWNFLSGEVDRSTMKILDVNYELPSDELDFYRELLKTCSSEHLNLKTDTNRTHCPSALEMLPVVKYARLHSNILMQKSVIKRKPPAVNKWLPVNKRRNQGFSLQNDETFMKVLDDFVMPESALDSVFADEIQLWRKNEVTVQKGEKDLFIEQIKEKLKKERKLFYEGGKQLRKDAFQTSLQHEEGQWNPKIMLPGGLISLGHVQSNEMDKDAETIRLLEQQIELLQKSQCCIKYSGQKQESKTQKGFEALQTRLEDAWNRLQIPESQRMELLAKLCLMADNRYEMVTLSQSTWKFVQLWERAAEDVTQREAMLIQEASAEIKMIDPTLYDKSVAEQRDTIQKKFLALNERLNETVGALKREYSSVLTFRGKPYLDKMKHDRSDLQYHIQLFRTTVQARNQHMYRE